ncbi:undecaprenyldiphospho-muramoylpentapeptide beta-N-acetylglucosaminyltransferase [Malonomonas rubra]|uniref:undecaprenyldiphospho-muramoylpentapeptide beta-N-acetylglucosaminyltransferase n=1 Tax=Malonomonas rubra TaxID=57040 RepID=UPI0026EAC886|nr:undecaprenyldiphospho-muramoylpentapeptide beta-N-acetylglucosaminyltransferase [Malonomonas rubra]
MRLLLAGGGTGGHLFPAVALAQLLMQQEPQAAVQFVGTDKGMEARMLPKLGLPLETVDMAGVVGTGWRGKLEMIPRLLKSMKQAHAILRKFSPDLVIGVGGYSSVPVLLVAKLLGISYAIHEQNATPGLSNKLLGRWATRIFLSFAVTGSSFDARKTMLTGNPLRQGFESVPAKLPAKGKLLIFGGSLGSQAINRTVVGMLPRLKEWPDCPEILHQTGEAEYEKVQSAYAAAGLDPKSVVPFIDDMATAYAEAKLVICRAGATTLAELTVCGRPALLIPFPFAAGDHQTTNARTLEMAGAAKLLPQADLTAEQLIEQVMRLFADTEQLQRMGEKGRTLGQPGAAEKILHECRQLVGTYSQGAI